MTTKFSRESFLSPAPKAPSKKLQKSLLQNGQRENMVALEIQFHIHRLLNDPEVSICDNTHSKLKEYQGLAFAGYHPSVGDLQILGAKQDVNPLITEFCEKTLTLIDKRRDHWRNTGYNQDEQIMHQDIDAVGDLTQRLKGEERIVFFGSARLKPDHPDYQAAKWISKMLVSHLAHDDGTTEQVITGGGPGVMEAANLGALEGAWEQYQRLMIELKEGNHAPETIAKIQNFRLQMHSIGVGIIVPHEQAWNRHLQTNLTIKSFAPRKVGLVSVVSGRSIKQKSHEELTGNGKRNPAIFGLTGGFGTLDELWEVATLMQCKKMPQVPIFVVGNISRIIKVATSILERMGTIKPIDQSVFIHCVDEVEALEKYLEYYNTPISSDMTREIDERKKQRSFVSQFEVSTKRIVQKLLDASNRRGKKN